MAINLRVAGAAEALHRQKWLDQEENLSGFLSRMLSSTPGASSFNVLETPREAFEAEVARRDAEDQAFRTESEQVTESEANWVVAHLTREGELTSAEKKLLQFLGAEASSIPPSLRALVERTAASA